MDCCQEIDEKCSSDDELEKNTVTSSRKEGLKPKIPVAFDHRYYHTMAVFLTHMSVKKDLEVFGIMAADTLTKEFAQLDKLGVLTSKSFSDLSDNERKEALAAVVLIKEERRKN